ncbi:MAG: amidohydrolase family protein [Acidobacteria bacterium]|nr:amidohydrolase family protein [Acidobacteriota bacterium]
MRVVACLVLLFGACVQAPPLEGPTPLALVGARLIDGTDAPPTHDAVVLIQGDRILAAGSRSAVRIPSNAETLDLAGKYILPGLIDLHVHYAPPAEQLPKILGAQLAFGVTAVRSVGTDDETRMEVLRQAGEGAFPAPEIWTSGLGFTAPGGHPLDQPAVYRPNAPDEARALVRELAAQQADFVKMWVDSKYGSLPKIPLLVREAIVDEAVEQVIPVVAHIFDEADVYHLGELGVTDFLHSVRDKEPMDRKFIDYALSKGIWFTPTLNVIESNWLFAENPGLLEGDKEAQAAMSPEALAQARDPEARRRKLEMAPLDILKPELGRSQRFVKQMHDAGVYIGLGSDSNGASIPAGWGTHNELRLLVEAGLTPQEAILAGTARAAMRLGVGAERGRLVPGYRADLLVLDADPLADIANSRSIARVMQGGHWVDREALLR